MSRLKPIGSEKLKGQAQINRILEIAKYKENLPNSVKFILEICTEPFDIFQKSPRIIQNKIINSLNNYKRNFENTF